MKKKMLLTGTFVLMLVFAMFLTGCENLDDLIQINPQESHEEPSKQPDEVRLDSSSLTLFVGDTETLTATVLSTEAMNNAVNWDSTNKKVASVDKKGTVSAISVGKTVIIVTTVDGGKTATCEILVTELPVVPEPPENIKLSPSSLTMNIGEIQTLTSTVTPTSAVTDINWRSDNPDVVEVHDGEITAISEGEAKVYAKTVVGSKQAFSKIKEDYRKNLLK